MLIVELVLVVVVNSAYYFSNEYLKTVKDESIEGCVNNIQIRNNKSSEKVQIRYSKRLRDQNTNLTDIYFYFF